jgi:hypothetical protein
MPFLFKKMENKKVKEALSGGLYQWWEDIRKGRRRMNMVEYYILMKMGK